MVKPIVMPFGLLALVDSRNHVLDVIQIPHWKGQFWGKQGQPIVKYRNALPRALTAEPRKMPFGMPSLVDSRNHVLDGY